MSDDSYHNDRVLGFLVFAFMVNIHSRSNKQMTFQETNTGRIKVKLFVFSAWIYSYWYTDK